ncbi:sulfurtransferase TusA family protein [Frankia sp. CNm7]|uniref:sulfurtransferase TusA family protein n=1 Tax=Frankia nepalensis TaxID=1836974 RepID=UPI001933275F|nr:sulfurtransferase TusA family protein [Frankia nepalensis]MBL7500674.1 sulfurtransferase TusA family protein [Frankia nepalensis]MBL7513140.1 sulfurtransferase TusA family protein [Frankia nepalensis]MBL7522114.1 sulfurtransferase TusA family protein [Frankia nepalensis]
MSDARGGGTADVVIDALGRRCPLPIIDLARRIGDVPVGGTIELLADDPAAAADVAAWCRLRGQELLGSAGHAHLVRRLA